MFYFTPFYTNMDLLGLDLYLCCIKLLIYILVITASSKKKTPTKKSRPRVGLRFASQGGEILLSMAISLYSLYLFFILFWFWFFFLFAVTFVIYFFGLQDPRPSTFLYKVFCTI